MTPDTPAQPWWRLLTREHWFVFIICSLAWLLDCGDQQFFNLARDPAMVALEGRANATVYGSYATSIFLVGWAVGGLIFGALGDIYGRARVLSLCVLCYSIFTGLCAFAKGFWDFSAYRFLTGLGVGSVFGLAVALVADTVPDKARAPALGLLQGLSTWGNMLAGVIGMGLGLATALPFGLKPWQTMFLIGALPALLCVPIMRSLKEPERWRKARDAGAVKGIKFGSYATLLGDRRWRRNAWCGLIMCSAGIVGLWGLGNFHPTIVRSVATQHFAAAGLSAEALTSKLQFWTSTALLLQQVGAFIGMMAMAKVAQVKGRRIAFGLAISCSFLTTVLVFWGLREFNQIFWMLPLMGFGQLGVFAVYAIYLPELFPTSLRSTGTSFCYNVGRLVAATAPFTVGRITKSLGGDVEAFRTAGLWASLVLLTGLLVLPFLPETKDQPLPDE